MIQIDTSKYEWSHGKKPRGHGLWWFDIDGAPFQATGKYNTAAKIAKALAISKKASAIKVLP